MKPTKVFGLIAMALSLQFSACINDAEEKPAEKLHPGEEAANVKIAPESLTSMEWTETKKELGSIREGQQLEVIYYFKNTGKKPLTIASAQPSCGCTVPTKPERPIMPGEQGEIKAVFDSRGRVGTNHKTITVMANTEPSTSHILEFDVNVLASEKAAGS